MKVSALTIIAGVALLQISSIPAQSTVGMGATEIDYLRHDFLQLEQEVWKIVNNVRLSQADRLEEAYRRFKDYIIDRLNINYNDDVYLTLKRFYEWQLLEQEVMTLNNLFEAFKNFLSHQLTSQFEELAALDFSETVLSDSKWPVNQTLEQIDLIMLKQGLYYKAATEAKSNICTTRQSAQLILFQMYNAMSLTELKAYAMMQFSWMLLKTYGKGNYTNDSNTMRKHYQQRIARTHATLRKVMERTDKAVWRCDPNVHIQDETYVMFTGLMQGYIENEVDLNQDNTCRETCGHYQLTESHSCYKDLYCARQRKCNGKLLNCQYVDSDMWVCPSKTSSHRRYDFIEYENGKTLGKHGSCGRGTTKVNSWWRWLFWHCSYCLCHCDEETKISGQSDRYFNLLESLSNTTENRVITGLRFVKRHRVIHLQIEEGELMPRGLVNESSTRWRPINDYTLIDRGIKEGVDYHTVRWNSRAIDLDDLLAPASHVVTGVRFRVVGTHLNLEARITELDFAHGLLYDKTSIWVSNDNTDVSLERRTEIKLSRPDVPTAPPRHLPDSKNNQYVEFSHSDIEADAAQSTIPYFDAQEVVSIPSVPLSGVGIYHKGRSQSGGFVAPKIFTYDFGPHIQSPELGRGAVIRK